MNEEMERILQMVADKTITAEEGQRLLNTLHSEDETAASMARRMVILVKSIHKGSNTRVNLPISTVKLGMKLGMTPGISGDAMNKVDMTQLMQAMDEMLASGQTGELMSVETEEEQISISLE